MDLTILYPCTKQCSQAGQTSCSSTSSPACQCSATDAVKESMCCAQSVCDASTYSILQTYVIAYCDVFNVNLGYVRNLDCRDAANGTDGSTNNTTTNNTSSGSSSGSSSRGGLSTAMIGGIAGGIAGALLLGGLAVWLCMRSRRPRQAQWQQQPYGVVPQQPGGSGPPPPFPQMAVPGAVASPVYTGGSGYTALPTQPVMSELAGKPAAAAAISSYPVANTLQKPMSAPIAPVSPVSPQGHTGVGQPAYGQGYAPPYQQHFVQSAELENTAPGPRELDGNAGSPRR
ncbi:uncharacterized protein B0I36DRAFT_385173 [Microdochium trichocladiopsis]|uniref:Extracellular membrane protein CFEM domain-containing protein n=1 Tax=Microdochium trichocladiopsis TaxID=1682393 RepID=A0A9P9BTG3_9PEZI|nr:uncharacterized protein B0I36DRAFT_385173 [Microdochium trichocladiopsis]KAH7029816.1 hypothetical protein B0I36DRAFT_385173 [Microdochium trichocladiopsis]